MIIASPVSHLNENKISFFPAFPDSLSHGVQVPETYKHMKYNINLKEKKKLFLFTGVAFAVLMIILMSGKDFIHQYWCQEYNRTTPSPKNYISKQLTCKCKFSSLQKYWNGKVN